MIRAANNCSLMLFGKNVKAVICKCFSKCYKQSASGHLLTLHLIRIIDIPQHSLSFDWIIKERNNVHNETNRFSLSSFNWKFLKFQREERETLFKVAQRMAWEIVFPSIFPSHSAPVSIWCDSVMGFEGKQCAYLNVWWWCQILTWDYGTYFHFHSLKAYSRGGEKSHITSQEIIPIHLLQVF